MYWLAINLACCFVRISALFLVLLLFLFGGCCCCCCCCIVIVFCFVVVVVVVLGVFVLFFFWWILLSGSLELLWNCSVVGLVGSLCLLLTAVLDVYTDLEILLM